MPRTNITNPRAVISSPRTVISSPRVDIASIREPYETQLLPPTNENTVLKVLFNNNANDLSNYNVIPVEIDDGGTLTFVDGRGVFNGKELIYPNNAFATIGVPFDFYMDFYLDSTNIEGRTTIVLADCRYGSDGWVCGIFKDDFEGGNELEGQIRLLSGTDWTYSIGGIVTTNKWYRLHIHYVSGSIIIYLDSGEGYMNIAESTYDIDNSDCGSIFIGTSVDGAYMLGKLDNIQYQFNPSP